MSAHKEVEARKRDAKRKKALLKITSGGGDRFPISAVGESAIGWAIVNLIEAGCYVAWYSSRDGNAICVQIRHDDMEPIKKWLKEEGELENLAQEVVDALASVR